MKIANSMKEKIKVEILLILIFIVSVVVSWLGFNYFEARWNYFHSFECLLFSQAIYAVMIYVLFNVNHSFKKRIKALI